MLNGCFNSLRFLLRLFSFIVTCFEVLECLVFDASSNSSDNVLGQISNLEEHVHCSYKHGKDKKDIHVKVEQSISVSLLFKCKLKLKCLFCFGFVKHIPGHLWICKICIEWNILWSGSRIVKRAVDDSFSIFFSGNFHLVIGAVYVLPKNSSNFPIICFKMQ